MDKLVNRSNTIVIHGGVLMLLAWWTLFDAKGKQLQRAGNELLLGSLLFGSIGVLIARAMALCLPFRGRPIAETAAGFGPWPAQDLDLIGWSAFPSDHAALFVAIALGIYFTYKPIGRVAIVWTVGVILLPRLYLGIHWPTDILVGSLIGVGCASLSLVPAIRTRLRTTIDSCLRRRPGVFYAFLFLWSYETVDLYHEVRALGRILLHHGH